MSPRQTTELRRRLFARMERVRPFSGFVGVAAIVAMVFLVGCTPDRAPLPPREPLTPEMAQANGLTGPQRYAPVDAVVTPPAGWSMAPLRTSNHHTHQIWLSPSGHTAYGVISFSLPLPVGNDMLVWGFMREMRRMQGPANLIDTQPDDITGGVRVVADGGIYRLRTIIFSRGWHGWAIYAGTLRDKDVAEDELHIAESARDHTAAALVH